jgi:hypothetical protein
MLAVRRGHSVLLVNIDHRDVDQHHQHRGGGDYLNHNLDDHGEERDRRRISISCSPAKDQPGQADAEVSPWLCIGLPNSRLDELPGLK